MAKVSDAPASDISGATQRCTMPGSTRSGRSLAYQYRREISAGKAWASRAASRQACRRSSRGLAESSWSASQAR